MDKDKRMAVPFAVIAINFDFLPSSLHGFRIVVCAKMRNTIEKKYVYEG